MEELLRFIERGILMEATEDYIQLWEISDDVNRYLNLNGDIGKIKKYTLFLIENWMTHGLLEPGIPHAEKGWKPWSIGTDDALKQIRHQWDQLNTFPNIGDIVWFALTEKGYEFVNTFDK